MYTIERVATFMPLVSAYCHCASKHLHRDAHAVTWILSFYSLIWITSLFSRLVRQVQCTYSNQGHKGKSKHSNFVYVITQILYIAMVVNFIFFTSNVALSYTQKIIEFNTMCCHLSSFYCTSCWIFTVTHIISHPTMIVLVVHCLTHHIKAS